MLREQNAVFTLGSLALIVELRERVKQICPGELADRRRDYEVRPDARPRGAERAVEDDLAARGG